MISSYLDLSNYGSLVDKLSMTHYHNENQPKDGNSISSLEYINYEKSMILNCKNKIDIGTINFKSNSLNIEFNSTCNPSIFQKDLYELISNNPIEEYTIHNAEKVNGDTFDVTYNNGKNDLKISINKDNKAFISDYKCEIYDKDNNPSEIIKMADDKVLYYDSELDQMDYVIDQGRIARFKTFKKSDNPFFDNVYFHNPSEIEIIDLETDKILESYDQGIDRSGFVTGARKLGSEIYPKNIILYKREKTISNDMRIVSILRPLLFDPFNFTNSMSNMWITETFMKNRKTNETNYTRKAYRVPEYRNDELVFIIRQTTNKEQKILDILI